MTSKSYQLKYLMKLEVYTEAADLAFNLKDVEVIKRLKADCIQPSLFVP